jgi:hypothetical protein
MAANRDQMSYSACHIGPSVSYVSDVHGAWAAGRSDSNKGSALGIGTTEQNLPAELHDCSALGPPLNPKP